MLKAGEPFGQPVLSRLLHSRGRLRARIPLSEGGRAASSDILVSVLTSVVFAGATSGLLRLVRCTGMHSNVQAS